MTTVNAALLAAACLFVLFVVAQALLPAIMRRGPRKELNARLSSAVARGTDRAQPADVRADALRSAAEIALAELKRPRLALRYARWADEASPGDARNIAVLAQTMMRAGRYRALERQLWRSMDAHPDAPAHDAAFDALLALYEGPMRAPERARVLRGMRRATATAEAR